MIKDDRKRSIVVRTLLALGLVIYLTITPFASATLQKEFDLCLQDVTSRDTFGHSDTVSVKTNARPPVSKFRPRKNGPPTHYLVMLADSDHDPKSAAHDLAQTYHGKIRHVYTNVLHGFAVEMSEENARQMSADPRVLLVEQDMYVKPTSIQTGTPIHWALDRIDQRTGLNGSYSYVKTGAGVFVYVVDSGIIRGLEDTAGVIDGYTNAYCPEPSYSPFPPTTPPCYPSQPFYDDVACNSSDGCHGTKVASIINGPNYGVAKNAVVINVRVFPYGRSPEASDVAGGLEWIVYHHSQHPNNPAVANISLDVIGGDNTPQAHVGLQFFEQAVINTIDAGVVVVCGAGNTGTEYPISNDMFANACNSSPARLGALGWGSVVSNPRGRTTITVSGTDESDERVRNYPYGTGYNTANTGACVDIFAPGWYVRAQPTFTDYDFSGTWFSGTSAASAYVAGVLALYLEGRGSNYDPNQVEAALKRNATVGVLRNVNFAANLFLYSRVDLWQ